MAENYVVKEVLTEDMVEAGEALLRELDQAGVPVEAALWYWDIEGPDWTLRCICPDADFHFHVIRALDKLSSKHKEILHLYVRRAMEGSELWRGLKAIAPIPGFNRQRLRNTLIGNHYIRDGLLYRAM
jgi:hypothetical protein